MSPEIWGKYAWNFIHLITLGYPTEPTLADKQNYYMFIDNLQYTLPCGTCRKNLSKHLSFLPLTDKQLENRDSFVKWGIDLHNVVNYYLGKPMLNYDEALQHINALTEKKKKRYDYVYLLLIVLVLAIILYLIYYILKKN